MWKLREEDRALNVLKIKEALLQLKDIIPEILHIEVGVNDTEAPTDNWDIVLVADFLNFESLDVYQKHPAHKEVAKLIGACRTERSCVDYKV